MMMKWCFSMLVLTAVLAGTVVAAEQERQRGERGQRGERAQAAQRGGIQQMLTAAGVEVTEEQKVKLDAIAKETEKVMAGIREAEDRQEAFAKAREKLAELRQKAMEVLTKEQRATLEKFMQERRERAGGERGPAERRKERPST
jgi:Spy/CpxP family protein refolding chaperone